MHFLTDQSINQSINQIINHSINQSMFLKDKIPVYFRIYNVGKPDVAEQSFNLTPDGAYSHVTGSRSNISLALREVISRAVVATNNCLSVICCTP